MPRRFVIMTVIGLLVAWTLGIVLLVRGLTAFGVWLLVGPTLATGFNAFLVRRSIAGQRAGTPQRGGEVTGRALAPPQPATPSARVREMTWSGGGAVATDLGRMNATWPLAVLTVRECTITLRFRPKLIGRMFGANPSVWRDGEIIAVYPVRGRLVRLNRGLAIESTTMPLAYFWTRHPEPVLAALGEHGVPVDWDERHIKLIP